MQNWVKPRNDAASMPRPSMRRSCLFQRAALLVAAGDEANVAGSAVVEIETLGAQTSGLLGAGANEHLIRLDRIDQPVAGGGCKGLRRVVRGAGVRQPKITFDHCENLG